jgi:hypothetical protein
MNWLQSASILAVQRKIINNLEANNECKFNPSDRSGTGKSS